MRFTGSQVGIEEVAPDFGSELGFEAVDVILPKWSCDDIVRQGV